jgi:hypothetical protein
MVNEQDARHLEHLCMVFSSLTEENKALTLGVSQALLTVQAPPGLPVWRRLFRAHGGMSDRVGQNDPIRER